MKNHIAEMTTAELMEIVGGGCEGGALRELLRRARAEERERCTKAVSDYEAELDRREKTGEDADSGWDTGAQRAALRSAIRIIRELQ